MPTYLNAKHNRANAQESYFCGGMLKMVLFCGVTQEGYLCGGLLKERTFMGVCSRRVFLWWKVGDIVLRGGCTVERGTYC